MHSRKQLELDAQPQSRQFHWFQLWPWLIIFLSSWWVAFLWPSSSLWPPEVPERPSSLSAIRPRLPRKPPPSELEWDRDYQHTSSTYFDWFAWLAGDLWLTEALSRIVWDLPPGFSRDSGAWESPLMGCWYLLRRLGGSSCHRVGCSPSCQDPRQLV